LELELAKALERRRRRVSRYVRGTAVPVALDRNNMIGLGPLAEANQVPTALSNNAKRHMSTRGKSDSTGRAWTNDDVVRAQALRRIVEAEAEGGVLLALVALNRDLR
jgi:hypothetical protein